MDTQIVKQTNQYVADPRQSAFLEAYYNPESITYSNAYRSAIKVGYSKSTAKDLLHNRPAWLSEKWGESKTLEPDSLLEKLSNIIDNGDVTTRDKLKAIELMMKHHGMLKNNLQIHAGRINIQNVLD